MQIKDNKILSTKNLEAGVFLLMGGVKTVQDYRSVGENYKQKILLNDVVVLTSSSLGMLGYRALGKNQRVREKIFKPTVDFFNKKFKNFAKSEFSTKFLDGKFDRLYRPLHTPIEYSKLIIGSCLNNVGMVGAGLFSAILGDFVLTKLGLGVHDIKQAKESAKLPKEPKKIKQVEQFMKKNMDAVVTKGVRKEMESRVTDLPMFNMLTTSFIGLEGLKITDEEKYSKQMKNATKYLIVNSLVPLFFLSLSSALTKKMKNIYRFPIMFAALVSGTYLVKRGVDYFTERQKINS